MATEKDTLDELIENRTEIEYNFAAGFDLSADEEAEAWKDAEESARSWIALIVEQAMIADLQEEV